MKKWKTQLTTQASFNQTNALVNIVHSRRQLILNWWEFMFIDSWASSFHSGSAAAAAHCPHTAVHNRLWLAARPPVVPVPCDSTAAYCQACRVRLPTCHWLLQLCPLTVINTWIAALQLHWLYTCTCRISIITERGSRGPCYHSLPRPSVMCVLPSMTDKRSCATQWHRPPPSCHQHNESILTSWFTWL